MYAVVLDVCIVKYNCLECFRETYIHTYIHMYIHNYVHINAPNPL